MQCNLTTVFAPFSMLALANSQAFQVTVYQNSDCSDAGEVAYIDVSNDWCFQGLGGNAFGYVVEGPGACSQGANQVITTWSGSNCEGSSANYYGPDSVGACNPVPFAAIELVCF